MKNAIIAIINSNLTTEQKEALLKKLANESISIRNKKNIELQEKKKVNKSDNLKNDVTEKEKENQEKATKIKSNMYSITQDELRILGKIMLTEFVGDLGIDEVNFLTKKNPLFGKLYSYDCAQTEFEKMRDDLINNIFTETSSKNDKLKEYLFAGDILSQKRRNSPLPFLYESTCKAIEKFKENIYHIYTKDGIIASIKEVHEAYRYDVSMYLKIIEKTFFESLTPKEKKFANVNNQEEFISFLGANMFTQGYEKCYNPTIVETIIPKESRMVRRIFMAQGPYIYSEIRSSRERKREIYNQIKKDGLLISEMHDLYYKKLIDDNIVTGPQEQEELYNQIINNAKSLKKK